MGCNCKATEIVLSIVILVFAFWQITASKWIIVIAAALLLIHALGCKSCAAGGSGNSMSMDSGSSKKKAGRKK